MYTFSGTAEHRFENFSKSARRLALFHAAMLAFSTVMGLIILACYYYTGSRGKDLVFYFLAGITWGEVVALVLSLIATWRFSKATAVINTVIFATVIYWLIHFGGQALLWCLKGLGTHI